MELNDSLLRPLLSLDVTPDGAGGGGFRGLCSVELFALSTAVQTETDRQTGQVRSTEISREDISPSERFIYRMYRVRSTSRRSVISYDVGCLVYSTYAVECVKCGRLKSVRWSYDCAST